MTNIEAFYDAPLNISTFRQYIANLLLMYIEAIMNKIGPFVALRAILATSNLITVVFE